MAAQQPFKPGELQDDPFVRAARYNDAGSEEHGIEGYVERLGLDLPKLIHLAEQRALRIVMLMDGQEPPKGNEPFAVYLSEEQRLAVRPFILSELDGIVIGYVARRDEERQS